MTRLDVAATHAALLALPGWTADGDTLVTYRTG